MQDVISFLDRNGQYKEMHIISVRHITDTVNEELVLEVAGIDDTFIINLSAPMAERFTKALFNGREALKATKTRKMRKLKEVGVSDEDIANLSDADINSIYKDTLFDMSKDRS